MSAKPALELTCSVETTAVPVARCSARNVSSETVHVFDSKRLPYLLLEDDGGLVLLYGVHPAPPLKNFNMVEIPTTRPLLPGDSLVFEAALEPLVLANHFEVLPTPAGIDGEHRLVGRVGWLPAPVTRDMVHRVALPWLLGQQRTVDAAPVTVALGARP